MVVSLDCVVVWVVVEVVLDDVTVERVLVVSAGVSEELLLGGLGVVNSLVVTMEDEELLLDFVVSGRLVKPVTRGVVTKLVLIQVPVVDLFCSGKLC